MRSDKVFVNNLIKILSLSPNYFSAKWFNDFTLDKSIRSKNGVIIFIDGSIIRPRNIEITDEDKRIISTLVKQVYERDRDEIIDKLLEK
jgi:hypothetical protein